MNNTALRAKAQTALVQSTDNKHMVFADKEHEQFYRDIPNLFTT